MGVPVSGMEAAEEKTAEALLSAFKGISAAEKRRHASVFNYWLAIRRDRDLPPIRDLDPLEVSDAGASSILLEIVEGGEDAEIRHVGAALKPAIEVSKVSDAPSPSVLSCVAGKIGLVSVSRDALAFENMLEGDDGLTRCSVTLLPFSSSGESVDFVYGLVSLETGVTEVEEAPEPAEETDQLAESAPEAEVAAEEQLTEGAAAVEETSTAEPEPEPVIEAVREEAEQEPEPEPSVAEIPPEAEAKPGFSKIFDALAGAKGFFGTTASAEQEIPPAPIAEAPEPVAEEPKAVEETTPVKELLAIADEIAALAEEPVDTAEEPAPVAEEPVETAEEPTMIAEETAPIADQPPVMAEDEIQTPEHPMEGTLQSKLADVRAKADEVRAAKLRVDAAIIDGLSAAYDFALDAEEAPEEYLRLVEGQGLKIQLRSPMKPVVKLAFDGYCDDRTIADLEAVLAWALKNDLPRGTLAERIESEGGISAILNGGQKRAA